MTVGIAASLYVPTRPVCRYHGGKWRLAPWIISHFPEHRIYCEPFCGAASVFMRKPRVHAEVLNDIDGNIVNLFRVLRDRSQSMDLERLVRLTPFSREEFRLSYTDVSDPVEQARRTLIRAAMGFGTTSMRRSRTGFRARSYKSCQTGPSDWETWPDQIMAFVHRLQGVTIEHLDAVDCIRLHDSKDTLFYVDPPYISGVRSSGLRGYRHEMTDADHHRLLNTLLDVKGMVVLSGYRNEMYDGLLSGWRRCERDSLADRGVRRTDALWMNFEPHARQRNLFEIEAVRRRK